MSSQSDLLEITGDDIAQLNDTDLRALIGMLCECDFRAESLSPAGVTWGGDQDDADGGLDVSVSGDRVPNLSGFIPDCNTGFQVKKPDMPKSAITKEMRPKGVLRDAIKSLVKAKGAYVIVSSNGSTTDLALKSRVDAMRDAVSGEEGFGNLHVDFYDRGRIATWVRLHPSMILWVRDKIGRPLTGWQPYGNWANSPNGFEEEYIVDGKLRLFNDNKRDDKGMPTEAGISELRENLAVPKASIRLVGLSGVGKTRLVQALFDERVGSDALNPTLAFYTDISGSPSPNPESFAKLLTALNQRAILVVDNCTPDLHRRLTEVCTEAGSEVSLITIEYDIREDMPEETNVFRLLPASGSVIESIILSRFKYLNQANARVIADFSDGNAKVAIALASNIEAGETLSGFKDGQLFERLFWQRNTRNENDSILTSAGVCSLLYSFDGVDTSKNSELDLLASLAEVSVTALYGDINRLKGRGLAQSRGQWRAILPHAVANRLARRTLDSIPKDIIVSTVLNSGSERVIKSFARRLSYLHDSEVAVEIAADWISEAGWIGKTIVNLSDFGMDVFKSIAPISPKDTLGAIRRAAEDSEKGQWYTSTANPKHISLVRLLRQLAYDPTLFEDSVFLMIKVNLSEKVDNNNSEVCNILQSLFRIKISGTHASPVQRANIITELLNSENERNQSIGIKLLEEALATRNLISSYGASFGAHPRDHGYRPRISGEYLTWFELFLGICKKYILAENSTSERVKSLVSDKMRDLWKIAESRGIIEDIIRTVAQEKFWKDAWISVNVITRFDDEYYTEDELVRLNSVRAFLRPRTLEALVRTYVLSGQNSPWGLMDENDEIPDNHDRISRKVKEIAASVYNDDPTFDLVLPELVSTYAHLTIRSFGQGLAEVSTDLIELWKKILSAFENVPEENRQINLLLGFLSSCSTIDSDIYNCILDDMLNHDTLIKWLHLFQTVSKIDQKGVERISKSLDLDKVKIEDFESWAYIDIDKRVSDKDLASLLEKIVSKSNSFETVFEILRIRFDEKNTTVPSERLLNSCRMILTNYKFSGTNKYPIAFDEEIATIAKLCLTKNFSEDAKIICVNICLSISSYQIRSDELKNTLNFIFEEYPNEFLNIFLENDCSKYFSKSQVFSVSFQHQTAIIDIPDEIVENWGDMNPQSRYSSLLEVIPTFYKPNGSENLRWRPFVYKLLREGEYLEVILPELAKSVRPGGGWSGTLEDNLQPKICLLEELLTHENEKIRIWASNQLLAVTKEIEWDFESIKKRAYQVDERFE